MPYNTMSINEKIGRKEFSVFRDDRIDGASWRPT
jgi:hypothetical protein